MADTPLEAFENPARHAAVSALIRSRSTNLTDVRDAVLHGLDLSGARAVLDLGCGFGFMTEVVARRVAPDAEIVGVDACEANEKPYLDRVHATGRRARFVCRKIERRLDWPDGAFDLVVASYSLYFFPGVIPEIARVLRPNGLFLAVTHTENSCRDLLHAAGLREPGAHGLGVIGGFSADNAGRRRAGRGKIGFRNGRHSGSFENTPR